MAVVATNWAAAENVFHYNTNLTTHLSLGVGFMSADVGTPIDLGGSRLLWIFGDTVWATASGQAQPFNGLGAPPGKLIHNTCVVSSGSYDPTAATFDWTENRCLTKHPSGSYEAWKGTVNIQGTPYYRYISGGKLIDGKLFLWGSYCTPSSTAYLSFNFTGTWCEMLDNISSTVDNWTTTAVPHAWAAANGNGDFNWPQNFYDDGTYVYGWGWGRMTPDMAYADDLVCLRWLRTDYKACRLKTPQYWNETNGWVYDRRHPADVTKPGQLQRHRSHKVLRYSTSGLRKNNITQLSPNISGCSVHKRTDGQWMLAGILNDLQSAWPTDATHLGSPEPMNLGYSLCASSAGPPNGPCAFTTWNNVYTIPETNPTPALSPHMMCYWGQALPVLTFTGKAADDVVMQYSTNGGVPDQSSPRFVKVTGL